MSGGEHDFVSGDDVSAHAGVIPVSRDVFSAPAGVIPASGDEHVSVHVEQDLYTSCVLAKLDQVLPQFARLDQKLPQLVEMDCHGSVHGSGRAGTVEVGPLELSRPSVRELSRPPATELSRLSATKLPRPSTMEDQEFYSLTMEVKETGDMELCH